MNRGDLFKITRRDELFNLETYQTRVGSTLLQRIGWRKRANGTLYETTSELTSASFELPVMRDGIALPPLTNNSDPNELTKWLPPDTIIRLEQVLFYTNNASSNRGKYQCLLVTTIHDDPPQTGFVWTIHGKQSDGSDNIFIERYVPVPAPNPSPEPNPPEPPTPQPGDATVQVHAGQTVVLELKTEGRRQPPQPDYPNTKVVVILEDEHGTRRDVTSRVVFIPAENSNGADRINEINLDIRNGTGGRDDIADGDYWLVIDNETKGSISFPVDTVDDTYISSNPAVRDYFSIVNMRYVRKGWVYRMINPAPDETWILNWSSYRYTWPQVQTELPLKDFYPGVYTTNEPTRLPRYSTDPMKAGELKPGSFIKIDKVLYFSKNVTSSGREPPFLACHISRPNSQGRTHFAWLCHDKTIPNGKEAAVKAEVVKTKCNVKGRTVIHLKSEDVRIPYGEVSGLAVQKAIPIQIPSIVSIDWVFPESGDINRNTREVFYKVNDGEPIRLLGVAFKRVTEVGIKITLSTRLENQELPITIQFLKKDIRQINRAPEGNPVNRSFTIRPQDHTQGDEYHLTLPTGEFYNIAKSLNIKLHFSVMELAIGSAQNNTAPIPSGHKAIPLLQHLLFFLPGFLGSELWVNGPGGEEECWPEFSHLGCREIELLVCNRKGEALRSVLPERLKVLDYVITRIPFTDLTTIYDVKNKVEDLKNRDAEFPKIYYRRECEDSDLVDPVIYEEFPYDWRLPMNNATPEKPFPFIESMGRRLEQKRHEIQETVRYQFAEEKISLAGHSTGGVMIQGLLSFQNPIKENIKNAFYLNVPFWGAPKVEYLLLTGNESEVNIFVASESLRQIGCNLPVAYFLSPRSRSIYNWSIQRRRENFRRTINGGTYDAVPVDLYGRSAANISDGLNFNQYLSDKAIEFDEYILNNYPNIPSYIFYSSGNQTICGTQLPAGDVNLLHIKDYRDSDSSRIMESLNRGEAGEVLTEELYLDQRAKVGIVEANHIWHISDKENRRNPVNPVDSNGQPLAMNYLYVIRMVDGEIGVFRKKSSGTIEPVTTLYNAGDGTVPCRSQLGLWHDHRDKNVTVTRAIHGNPEHTKSPNQEYVWHQVFNVFRREDVYTYPQGTPPPEYVINPLSTLVIEVKDRDARNILINNADVELTCSTNSYDEDFETRADGKLIIPELPIGDYEVVIEKEGYNRFTSTISIRGDSCTVNLVAKLFSQWGAVQLKYFHPIEGRAVTFPRGAQIGVVLRKSNGDTTAYSGDPLQVSQEGTFLFRCVGKSSFNFTLSFSEPTYLCISDNILISESRLRREVESNWEYLSQKQLFLLPERMTLNDTLWEIPAGSLETDEHSNRWIRLRNIQAPFETGDYTNVTLTPDWQHVRFTFTNLTTNEASVIPTFLLPTITDTSLLFNKIAASSNVNIGGTIFIPWTLKLYRHNLRNPNQFRMNFSTPNQMDENSDNTVFVDHANTPSSLTLETLDSIKSRYSENPETIRERYFDLPKEYDSNSSAGQMGANEQPVNELLALTTTPENLILINLDDHSKISTCKFYLKIEKALIGDDVHPYINVQVEIIDEKPIPDRVLLCKSTGADGKVLFAIYKEYVRENRPDIFFRINLLGQSLGLSNLSEPITTQTLRATNGTKLYLKNYSGDGFGSESEPVTLQLRVCTYPVRKGNLIKFYNDGFTDESCTQGAFIDIAAAIENAQHFIFIADWSFHPLLELMPNESDSDNNPVAKRLIDWIEGDSNRVVCIHTWNHTNIGAPDKQNDDTKEIFEKIFKLKDNPMWGSRFLFRASSRTGLGWSHHQKFIVCDGVSPDDGTKKALHAFIGGLDLSKGRLDFPSHPVYMPNDIPNRPFYFRNRRSCPDHEYFYEWESSQIDPTTGEPVMEREEYYYNEWYNPELLDERSTIDEHSPYPARQPWHDTHARIIGPSAWDILHEFVGRWLVSEGGFAWGHDNDTRHTEKIQTMYNDIKSHSSFQQANHAYFQESNTPTWSVQLLRSMHKDHWGINSEDNNLYYNLPTEHEKSILEKYVDAIRKAEKFIYIETQYFIGSGGKWVATQNRRSSVANELPHELVKKISDKHNAGSDFHVYLIVPLFPEGKPMDAANQAIRDFQWRSIEYIIRELHGRGITNWNRYFTVGFLANWTAKSAEMNVDDSSDRVGRIFNNKRYMVYVHSKLMIVDDNALIIGSCNLNERGLSGNRDSEICIGVNPDEGKIVQCTNSIKKFRMRLWEEHFNYQNNNINIDHPEIYSRAAEEIQKLGKSNFSNLNTLDSGPNGHFCSYDLKLQSYLGLSGVKIIDGLSGIIIGDDWDVWPDYGQRTDAIVSGLGVLPISDWCE